MTEADTMANKSPIDNLNNFIAFGGDKSYEKEFKARVDAALHGAGLHYYGELDYSKFMTKDQYEAHKKMDSEHSRIFGKLVTG